MRREKEAQRREKGGKGRSEEEAQRREEEGEVRRTEAHRRTSALSNEPTSISLSSPSPLLPLFALAPPGPLPHLPSAP